MRRLVTLAAAVVLCFSFQSSCKGRSSDQGGGGIRVLACSDQILGSLKGPGDVTPDFTNRGAAIFFQIDPQATGSTAIQIALTSTSGDANLHLAAPGAAPGSQDPGDYIFASELAPPANQDWIHMTVAGLENPSTFLPSTTLQDYRLFGGRISFAVWGVLPATEFQVDILCQNALDLPCGTVATGSVPGSGTLPPDFAGGTEVHFFQVQNLPAAPGSLSILATSLTGDVNLYLGRPGLNAPGMDLSEYVFSSTAGSSASPNDLILVDAAGLHDVFGFTDPTVTLQHYLSSGSDVWFALAGLAGSNDYSLQVSCSAVIPLGCGDSSNGSTNGSAQSPPDLGNPLETKFYQLEPLPPTATFVTIQVDSITGDTDLYLAAPGAVPGSTTAGDYVFSSLERAPTNQDRITIDMAGLQDASGGSSSAVNLADYLQVATPLGVAVAGYAGLSSFRVTVTCVAPPQVFPIDCGGGMSAAVSGSGQMPPDLSDLSENIWLELTSIPPGANRVEISFLLQDGDASVLLAAPGVSPGNQSLASYPELIPGYVGFAINIIICDTGIASPWGNVSSPTLGDYVASSENLSFVIAGYDLQSSFDLSVTCSSGPSQHPSATIACGDSPSGQVAGSARFPPDLSNPAEAAFFEISPIPPGTEMVSITVSSFTGNADLHIARPGTAPGSACNADYDIYSAWGFGDEVITIANCGISGAWTNPGALTLGDYAVVDSIVFAVVGWDPLSNYTVNISCGAANPARPTDCGGTATDTVSGGFSFSDPATTHIYEIPLASVQASSSILLEFFVGFDDADPYLAGPGVVPGSICDLDYIFNSYSTSNPDWIRIDTTGLYGADGWWDNTVTIADYQAASTNLSFAIQGWSFSTTYNLVVTCN